MFYLVEVGQTIVHIINVTPLSILSRSIFFVSLVVVGSFFFHPMSMANLIHMLSSDSILDLVLNTLIIVAMILWHVVTASLARFSFGDSVLSAHSPG